MKYSLVFVVVASVLTACAKEKKIASVSTEKELINYVESMLESDYKIENTQFYTVRHEVEADSNTTIYLDPEYNRFPDNECVESALRWMIRVPIADIRPYGMDRYLVKYFSDDTDGNHYPASSYWLIAKQNGAWRLEKKLLRQLDEDVDLTIKKIKDGRMVGERTGDRDGGQKAYYSLVIRGDSLLKDKLLAANDTL